METISRLIYDLCHLVADNPIAQFVGLVALGISVISYQAKTTRGIAFRQAFGSFFWVVHLFMLGAWTGGLLNILGLVRGTIYSQRGVRAWASRPFWPWLLGVLCVGAAAWAGVVQGEGPRLVVSATAQCLGCYGLWTPRVGRARGIMFASSVLWLIYDASSGSIPGVACELFSEISIIIAFLRAVLHHRQ